MELSISARAEENGALNSARCSLDRAVTLGRGPDSPVPLDGTGISREHLRLHSDGGAIFVTDLSSNGTWLNTRRLPRGEAHALAAADAIRIPGFEIRLDFKGAAEAVGAQSPGVSPAGSEIAAQSPLERGLLQSVRDLGGSLSKLERLLIGLALATLALAVLYLAS